MLLCLLPSLGEWKWCLAGWAGVVHVPLGWQQHTGCLEWWSTRDQFHLRQNPTSSSSYPCPSVLSLCLWACRVISQQCSPALLLGRLFILLWHFITKDTFLSSQSLLPNLPWPFLFSPPKSVPSLCISFPVTEFLVSWTLATRCPYSPVRWW